MSIATGRSIVVFSLGLIAWLSLRGWNEPPARKGIEQNAAIAHVEKDKSESPANISRMVMPDPPFEPVVPSNEPTHVDRRTGSTNSNLSLIEEIRRSAIKPSSDLANQRRPRDSKFNNLITPMTNEYSLAKYKQLQISPEAAKNILKVLNETRPSYWQANLGSVSFGRVYQGKKSFLTLSMSVGAPRWSFQRGKYKKWNPVQSGLSVDGTIGGGPFKITNRNFASYTSTGLRYCGRDCLKIYSDGGGTPQVGVALTVTIQTR